MVWSHVGSVAGTGNNPASGTLTIPGSPTTGDLVLVWLYSRAGVYDATWDSPVTEKHASSNGTNGALVLGYFYYNGETDVSFTRTTASSNSTTIYGCDVFRGAFGSGDPFEADTGATPDLQTTQDPDPPAVTATSTDAAIWAIGGKRDDAAGSITAPTDYTLGANADSIDGADAAAASIYRFNVTGSQDPGVIDMGGTSTTGLAWTGALKPAAGSSPTTLTPAPVAVSLDEIAPTLGLSLAFAPSPVAATVDEIAPTIGLSISFAPSPVAAVLDEVAPTLATPLTLAPDAVAVTLEAIQPTVEIGVTTTLSPDPVVVVLEEVAPTLGLTLALAPSAVAVTLDEVAPTISTSLALTPDPVAVVLDEVAPALATSLSLTPTPVAVTLDLVQPTVVALVAIIRALLTVAFDVLTDITIEAAPATAITIGAVSATDVEDAHASAASIEDGHAPNTSIEDDHE